MTDEVVQYPRLDGLHNRGKSTDAPRRRKKNREFRLKTVEGKIKITCGILKEVLACLRLVKRAGFRADLLNDKFGYK